MFTNAEWTHILELVAQRRQQAIEKGTIVPWTDPVNGREYFVHPPDKCEGERCVFHNPSDHSMRDLPIILRETGLIERGCPHGIGHPDPDSLDYFTRNEGEGWGVHGCDGCCSRLPSSTG